MIRRRAALAMLSCSLGACGFRPLYAPVGRAAKGAQADLAQVQVALIPERYGQLLRQALQQRLDRGEGLRKRYELSVSYSLSVDAVSYQVDASVTRLRLTGTGNWTLKALDTGGQVSSGSARALDGLDILDQQYFAADIANETTQRRVAENVANQITLQIASFFTQRKTAG